MGFGSRLKASWPHNDPNGSYMSLIQLLERDSANIEIVRFNSKELEWARENVGTDVDWEMFDDMALESEGVYVGMTSAGMAVDILEISACGYLSWRAHSNSDATNERVGEFAALVRSVRQNGSIATCRLIADHPEERADPTRDSRFRDVRIELNNKSIDFKLSVQLYFDWIESLRFDGVTLAEFVTIETYAELLIQFWADPLN